MIIVGNYYFQILKLLGKLLGTHLITLNYLIRLKLQDLNVVLKNTKTNDIADALDELTTAKNNNHKEIDSLNMLINKKKEKFINNNKKQPEYLIINEHDYNQLQIVKHLFEGNISGYKMYCDLKILSSPELVEGEILIL